MALVPVRGLPVDVESVAEVPRGHLWVAIREHGLFQVAQGSVIQEIPWAELGHKDPVRVLVTDPSQRGLWLGFAQGGVAYFADGRIQNSYSVAEGVGAGKVNGLGFGMRGALWVATESGLTRIKDGRITTFASNNGLPCNTVHWSMDYDEHAAGFKRRLVSYELADPSGTLGSATQPDPLRLQCSTSLMVWGAIPTLRKYMA